MSDQPQPQSDAPTDAPSCGICGSADVSTFEGFHGEPDSDYCMNCGAWREGDEAWNDPNEF